MKMKREFKLSINGKLPFASLLLQLSFSLALLLLCPKPKSTRRRISSVVSNVSSLYPLFLSSSFSAGFFSSPPFSTNLTNPKKKKKCSLCLFFHPNREPRCTSSMTLKKSTKKKMRISFAHGSLKTSHPENLMHENYPIAS